MFFRLRKILKRFRPSRQTAVLSLVLIFALVGIFGAVVPVNAGISEIIALIIFYILSPFYILFGGLLVLVIWLLGLVASYNGFIDSPAVTIGWTVVRDLCNMFFILILLVIAVSTILGVENYHYKKHLKNLLLMAVLINFSKLFAGLMIDLVQVVTLTFINAYKSMGPGVFIDALGINRIFSFSGSEGATGDESAIAAALLGLPMIIITLVVVTIMLLTFLMRIIMIWILIVLSPLAFLLTAAPGAKKYADMWWSEWGKYLIVGPVLAFFLWLSIGVMKVPGGLSSTVDTTNATSPAAGGVPAAAVSTAGTAASFLGFIIGIAMLIGGLVITSKAGLAGAGMAGAATGWAKDKATGIAKFPLKAGAGWVDRRGAAMYSAGKEEGAGRWKRMAGLVGLGLSGTTRREAYKAHVAREEQKVFPAAAGNFQDFLNERFNPFLGSKKVQDYLRTKGKMGEKAVQWFGGEKTYAGKIAGEQTMAARQDEVKKANLDEIKLAQAVDGAKGEIEIGATIRQVLLENRQDDLSRYLGKQNEGKTDGELEAMGIQTASGREFMRGTYSPEGFRDYLKNVKMKGLSENKKAEMANHLTEYAEANGKVRGFAIGYRDNEGQANWVDGPLTKAERKEIEKKADEGIEAGTIRPEQREAWIGGEEKKKIDGRVSDEFNKRTRRTDAEKIAGALEACVFRKQFSSAEENEERDPNTPSIFGNFTAEGANFFRDLSAAHMESLLKSRKAQARLIQTVGVEEIEGEKHVDVGKLAESYKNNGQATDAILTKAGFSPEETENYKAQARAKLIADGVDVSGIPQLKGVKTSQEKVAGEERKIRTQETKLTELKDRQTTLAGETKEKPPETEDEAKESGKYTKKEKTGKSRMVGGKWEDVEEDVFDKDAWTGAKAAHETKAKELEKTKGEITKVEATIEGSKVSVANSKSQVINAALGDLKSKPAKDIDLDALRDLQDDIGSLRGAVADVRGALENSLGSDTASEVISRIDELDFDLAGKIRDGTAESGLSIPAIHDISKTVSDYLEDAQKGKEKK